MAVGDPGMRAVSAVPNDAADLPPPVTRPAVVGPRPAAESRMREIHDVHSGPLFRFLVRLTLGDRSLAEDLLQETMLRAWRNLEVLPLEAERISRWLYTVARNVAIDAARARRIRPPEVTVHDISWIEPSGDPLDRLVTAHTVRRGLERLTADHRSVLVELYFRGSSTAEAAVRLGIPEGTVKSRAYYALRALHAAVGPTESA